jgi:periplasmic divalent cation tolerance protein
MMATIEDVRIVFVTCPPGFGPKLLRRLIEERLVAGGNILSGVRSMYRWKEEIADEPEEVVFMETASDRVPAMMARVRELHPYEVPKVLAFSPKEGLTEYLGWVLTETRESQT